MLLKSITAKPSIINFNKTVTGIINPKSRGIKHINELIKASPRFYKQHANYNVPAHQDIDTLCCVNILISKDNAPVHFEDWGEYTYHCALLNVTHRHKVDPWSKERHLLKLSIFDRTYEQVREELKDYISPEQGFIQK